MEPSQLGSLKGLKRDKGHEGYTGSTPYGEGKTLLQLRWNYKGFDDQGANPLCLATDLMFSLLSRRRVIPLYTRADVPRPRVSRPAYKQYPAW